MNIHKQRPIAVIFGGTGLIGHAAVQALAKAGYQIRIPTRNLDRARDLKTSGPVGQITPVHVNRPSDAGLMALMKGAKLVVNLIGTLQDSKHKQDGFLALHVELPARIARLAKAVGVTNFIHLSAQGASEQAENTYETSKAMGERAVRTFFPEAIVLKPNLIYGPRDRLLNRMADLARFMPILPMAGSGKNKSQPIYVADVARAIVACTKNAALRSRVFELNGPERFTQKEILQLMMNITGDERPLLPLPLWMARLASYMPFSPVPGALLKLCCADHCATSAPQMRSLGITPAKMGDMMERYLIEDQQNPRV